MTKSRYRRLIAVPDLKTRTCPGCRSDPALMIGTTQWFCENEDCAVLMWNPTMTREDLLRITEGATP